MFMNSGNGDIDFENPLYGEDPGGWSNGQTGYVGYYLEGNFQNWGWVEVWSDVFTSTGLVHDYDYENFFAPGALTTERIQNLLPDSETVTMDRAYNLGTGQPDAFTLFRDETQASNLHVNYGWGDNGKLATVAADYPSTGYADGNGRRNELFKYAYTDPANGFLPTSLKSRYVDEVTNPLTETAWTYHATVNSVNTMTNTVWPTVFGGLPPANASSHTYALDVMGRRVQHDFLTAASPNFGRRQAHFYNEKGEVGASNAHVLNSAGAVGNESKPDNRQYSFDELGNRHWAAGGLDASAGAPTGATPPAVPSSPILPRVLDEFSTSPANTYDERSRSVGGAAGAAVARKYDADGNMIFDGYFSYVWDCENRLVHVYPGETLDANGDPVTAMDYDAELKFSYDYRSRRISRERRFFFTGYPWLEMSTERFVYDGWNMVFSRRNNTFAVGATPSGWMDNVWVWGQDISGMGGSGAQPSLQGAGGVGGLLVATLSSSTTGNQWDTGPAYYHYDGNGNVTSVISSWGQMEVTYRYDAFGNAVSHFGGGRFNSTPWNEPPYTFSTKWRESTNIYASEVPYAVSTNQQSNDYSNIYSNRHSALHYYGYRYYAPKDGRWLGRDPVGERGGVNLFGSVGNGVINQIDILGLDYYTSPDDGHHEIFWPEEIEGENYDGSHDLTAAIAGEAAAIALPSDRRGREISRDYTWGSGKFRIYDSEKWAEYMKRHNKHTRLFYKKFQGVLKESATKRKATMKVGEVADARWNGDGKVGLDELSLTGYNLIGGSESFSFAGNVTRLKEECFEYDMVYIWRDTTNINYKHGTDRTWGPNCGIVRGQAVFFCNSIYRKDDSEFRID